MDEFDDVTSTSSGLTTDTSSSDLADGSRPRSNSVHTSAPAAGVAVVEEPEPVIWRRFFQSNGANQKTQDAETQNRSRDKGKGKRFPAYLQMNF